MTTQKTIASFLDNAAARADMVNSDMATGKQCWFLAKLMLENASDEAMSEIIKSDFYPHQKARVAHDQRLPELIGSREMIELSQNDFLTINGKRVGILKSRKGEYVNSPSARDDRTTVFYEIAGHGSRGPAHEIALPSMIHDADDSEKVNPEVIEKIRQIVGA